MLEGMMRSEDMTKIEIAQLMKMKTLEAAAAVVAASADPRRAAATATIASDHSQHCIQSSSCCNVLIIEHPLENPLAH